MYSKHHTKGIVLFGLSEGLSDRRVGLLTENLGLVWAKAQSARSGVSKLRLSCQDFSLGEFSLVSGKAGWRIVSGRSQKNFFEILKDNPEKIRIMANVFALLRKLLSGEEASPTLFVTISNFLEFLVLAKPTEVAPLEWLTLSKILHILGFLREDPEISSYINIDTIDSENLALLAPKRERFIKLINESLSVARIGT